MRKQLLYTSFSLAITFLILSGCGKETDPAPAKTKTELMAQSSWKFDKATASGTDITGSVTACLKDNVVVFATNGTANVDEATTVCSPTYAGSYTWAFQSSEAVIHLSAPLFPGGSNDFTLVSLTESNLVVSQLMTIAPFPATVVEVTFKH